MNRRIWIQLIMHFTRWRADRRSQKQAGTEASVQSWQSITREHTQPDTHSDTHFKQSLHAKNMQPNIKNDYFILLNCPKFFDAQNKGVRRGLFTKGSIISKRFIWYGWKYQYPLKRNVPEYRTKIKNVSLSNDLWCSLYELTVKNLEFC